MYNEKNLTNEIGWEFSPKLKLDAPFWLPTAKDHWAAQAKHAEKKIRTKKPPSRFRLAIRVRGGSVGA